MRIIRNTTGEGLNCGYYYDPENPGAKKLLYLKTVRASQETEKFKANLAFARALPKMRARYREDLKGNDRKAIIALIVALMDQAFFRIGTKDTDDEGVYGVTTLRKWHLKFKGNEAHFDYDGKKKQEQHKMIVDPKLFAMLKTLRDACKSRNDRLFRHEGRPIGAAEVNAYLKDFGVTAKMFRTYHATRLAREKLLPYKNVETKKEREKILKAVVEEVAEIIGHEPGTCRAYYIDHDRVIDPFLEGRLK